MAIVLTPVTRNKPALNQSTGAQLATLIDSSGAEITGFGVAAPTTANMQTAAAATGNGTVLVTTGMSSAIITISGTFVGTVTFEGTQDGTIFTTLSVVNIGTNTISGIATAPGIFQMPCSGLSAIRARVSAWTSGSITAKGTASPNDYSPKVVNVNLVQALIKTVDSITSRPEATTPVNLTASANATRTGGAILVGMYVNSTTAGTIKIYDSLTQTGTVLNNTITPAVGWHNLGMATVATGLSETIGGTLDVTLYYIPTP